MHETAIRWKNGSKWSPFHWRPERLKPALCGYEKPDLFAKEEAYADPYRVTCGACNSNPALAEAKQKYDRLVSDAYSMAIPAGNNASSLVVPACNLANKHDVTFEVANGLLFMRMLGTLKPKREAPRRGRAAQTSLL